MADGKNDGRDDIVRALGVRYEVDEALPVQVGHEGVQPPYVQPEVCALQTRYNVDGKVVGHVDMMHVLETPDTWGDDPVDGEDTRLGDVVRVLEVHGLRRPTSGEHTRTA
eukprot:11130037-Alexandrium_andersonii.AAC.1